MYTASGTCTVDGDTATVTGVGECTITADQPGDATTGPAASVSQSTTSVKADQTISWTTPPPARAGVGSTFVVAATADSDLPVSYIVSGGCTLAADRKVTMTAKVPCTVTAQQAGDSDHNAAPALKATVAPK